MANLFLHYAFDAWMGREHPELPWCRYADDGLVHCRTLEEAEAVKAALQKRLAECGLEMHPTKTRIIYCMDERRKGKYPETSFDFLGYTFRTRKVCRIHSCGKQCGAEKHAAEDQVASSAQTHPQ